MMGLRSSNGSVGLLGFMGPVRLEFLTMYGWGLAFKSQHLVMVFLGQQNPASAGFQVQGGGGGEAAHKEERLF